MAMTMKADATLRSFAQSEDAEREDRGEHDRHEEVAQEHAEDGQPAQLEEDQEAHQDVERSVQADDLVGGDLSQQAGAGETAGQEADEAQGRQEARRPVAEAQDAVLEGQFLGKGIRQEHAIEPAAGRFLSGLVQAVGASRPAAADRR